MAEKTNGRTKVTPDQVQTYLRTGKRTIKDVAAKFGVTAATARKHVGSLLAEGSVDTVGTRPVANGGRGRPSKLYYAQA